MCCVPRHVQVFDCKLFTFHVYLSHQLRLTRSEFRHDVSCEKTRIMWLLRDEKSHRRSQEVQWVRRKFFRRNLRGKFVSAFPQTEQESILGPFLLGGGDSEVGVVCFVVLDRLLRAKKGRQHFEEKSAPQTKFWLHLPCLAFSIQRVTDRQADRVAIAYTALACSTCVVKLVSCSHKLNAKVCSLMCQ